MFPLDSAERYPGKVQRKGDTTLKTVRILETAKEVVAEAKNVTGVERQVIR
jgi:hypothetical protein